MVVFKPTVFKSNVFKSTCAALSVVLITAGSALAGNWQVDETPFGVLVSNPETNESFPAVNRRAAEKQAKHLNKLEDKQKKKEDKGVWDDGSGACNDPLVRC